MPPPEIGKPLYSERKRKCSSNGSRKEPVWADHWAYVDPVKHSQPQVIDSNWPTHWIDRFHPFADYQRRINSNQPPTPIPSPLIRRLHFRSDGTCHPHHEEVTNFATNPSPRKRTVHLLIDDLLASPHFGERMASVLVGSCSLCRHRGLPW